MGSAIFSFRECFPHRAEVVANSGCGARNALQVVALEMHSPGSMLADMYDMADDE